MAKMIFVNLPVTDLPRSMKFYEAVGFTNNPMFTNDQAAAMAWSDEIVVMLLRHDFWKTFTSKTIPNAHDTAQVLLQWQPLDADARSMAVLGNPDTRAIARQWLGKELPRWET